MAIRVVDIHDELIMFLRSVLSQSNQKANDIGTMVSPEDILMCEWDARKDLWVGFYPDKCSRAVYDGDATVP